MSHSQNKELDRIPLGSMDFYVVEYTGSIPDDATFEIEKNMIGRTKNGATVTYGAEWHTAESDDGKAKKRRLIKETASISYGAITWNANTLSTLIATARVEEDTSKSKRTVKIGGISNENGKRYLIRGVCHDKVDGDIRITGLGVNTGGWESVFKADDSANISPKFELDPIDSEGTLLIFSEEIIETSEE